MEFSVNVTVIGLLQKHICVPGIGSVVTTVEIANFDRRGAAFDEIPDFQEGDAWFNDPFKLHVQGGGCGPALVPGSQYKLTLTPVEPG